MSRHFYLGLTPWLLFLVADRADGIGPVGAAFLSLAASILVAIYEVRAHRPTTLSLSGAGLFLVAGCISAAGLWSPPVARYDRAIATLFLALCLAVSLRRIPLTEHYGAVWVARRQASEPAFRRYCRMTTRRWTITMTGVAVSLALGAEWHDPLLGTVGNWLIPLVLIGFALSGPSAPMARQEESMAYRGLTEALLTRGTHSPFRPRLIIPPHDRRGRTRR